MFEYVRIKSYIFKMQRKEVDIMEYTDREKKAINDINNELTDEDRR